MPLNFFIATPVTSIHFFLSHKETPEHLITEKFIFLLSRLFLQFLPRNSYWIFLHNEEKKWKTFTCAQVFFGCDFLLLNLYCYCFNRHFLQYSFLCVRQYQIVSKYHKNWMCVVIADFYVSSFFGFVNPKYGWSIVLLTFESVVRWFS